MLVWPQESVARGLIEQARQITIGEPGNAHNHRGNGAHKGNWPNISPLPNVHSSRLQLGIGSKGQVSLLPVLFDSGQLQSTGRPTGKAMQTWDLEQSPG